VVTVIELDLDAPAAPRPARRRRRPARGPAAAVAAAVALLLGGAAPPLVRPWERSAAVTDVATSAFDLSGDGLYLARPDGSVSAHTAGGAQRWSTPFPRTTYLRAEAAGDVVVLHGERSDGGGPTGQTTVVDAGTGLTRWSRVGALWDLDPTAGAVVLGRVSGVDAVPPQWGTPPSVAVVELATGREQWRWEAPRATLRVAPVYGAGGRIAGVAHYAGDGAAELLDLATRASRRLPGTGVPRDAHRHGDTLVVLWEDGGQRVLQVYDWAGLRPRWRVADRFGAIVGACGRWLCVQTPGGVTALDPATGEARWQGPGVPYSDAGGRLVLGSVTPGLTVVDARDGRHLLRLTGWSAVGPPAGGRLAVLRWKTGGRVAQLAVVELDSLRVYPVAELVTTVRSCRSTAALVACRDSRGQIVVWRLG
jgi:hypothetical protein